MADENENDYFEIHEDEAFHYHMIDDDIEKSLALAESAAILTLNGLVSIDDPPPFGNPEIVKLFLIAKSAKDVRFAVMGLKCGYYSGASAVLRSAFEALSFVALFDEHPGQIAQWLRNEIASVNKGDKTCDGWEDQVKQAKKALINWEECQSRWAFHDVVNEFIWNSNKSIHSTVNGLARDFGIDIDDLVPDEINMAYNEVDGTIDKALNYYYMMAELKKKVPGVAANETNEQTEIHSVELSGRYDYATISELALIAFYLAHRMLDFASNVYGISDKDFITGIKEWHKAIK